MALAGCYASPVFDIFVGLGLSFAYVCLKRYPEPYRLELDTATFVSLLFAYISLISTLVVVSLSHFKYEKKFGLCLIALYVLYQLVQAAILISSSTS